MTNKRKQRKNLRGSVRCYLKPTEPVAVEDWDAIDADEYYVPKSRLKREWKKWSRKSKAGAEVFFTRCGKDPVLLILLSKSDFNLFAQALEREPRSMPDSIRKTKANYETMIVSDEQSEISIDPEKVFAQVEADRLSGELSEKVTTAKIRYQSSDRPGYIEQINTETGERRLGTFANGVFTPIEVENLPEGPVGKEFGGPDCEYE
jgi:hypothetical protein